MSNATSRYANTPVISGSYFGTYKFPNQLQLTNIQTVSIRTTENDRLDTLAARYLGDDSYWWVIAELNNIDWAFNFVPGDIIRIPSDVNDILKFF